MNNEHWLERLQTLVVRFSHLGMGADISTMTLGELWGLYRFLSHLEGKDNESCEARVAGRRNE